MSSPGFTLNNCTLGPGYHSCQAYAPEPLRPSQKAKTSTPACAMLFWLPRFTPVTDIPPSPTQNDAWSMSPSQMLPPFPLKACCGTGTGNSASTHEKDFVLLHFVPGKVFTTPLQPCPVALVGPNDVPWVPTAEMAAFARLP